MDIREACNDFFENFFDHATMSAVGIDDTHIFVYTKKKIQPRPIPSEWCGYPIKVEYVGVIRAANDED